MNKNYARAEKIMRLLDTQYSFAGIKLGLDPLIGLFPVVGDVVSVVLALYIVYIGVEMGIKSRDLVMMILNIGMDFLLGTVPVVGDIADVIFRANERNMNILRKYYGASSNIVEGEVVS
jgi:hypothetical protein